MLAMNSNTSDQTQGADNPVTSASFAQTGKRGGGAVNGDFNWIANFIWGIADDVLRDLYTRGKYRDVILPMTVLRRLDSVLEPTKQAVPRMARSRALPQFSSTSSEAFQ